MMKNGASRWISVGPFSYQPSELVKFTLPVYLAHLFAKKNDRFDDPASSVLPPAIVSTLFCGLIYLQNNFSTAVFLGVNAILLFFMAGVRLRHFLLTSLIALPISVLLVFTKEHRVARIMSYFYPEADPMGAGYQVRSSVETFLSGGLWGKGLGRGTRKIASVPEIHSDFVFSAYGEEFGFIGVLACFALFAFFAVRAYRAALRTDDVFRRLLGFGMTTMIAGQALLNLAVVIGAVPATGVPLPFFSAGGSSLAATLAMAGILVNISRPEGRGDHDVR
jgi:cell division protein FtsW